MQDWRTKPRIGRQAFMQFIDEISKRLSNGETQIQIYKDLKIRGFSLSYKQFNSYVRKIILGTKSKQFNVNPTHIVINQPHQLDSDIERQKVRNPAELKKLRMQPIDLEELENYNGDRNESSNY